MSAQKRSVEIPANLYRRIEEHIRGTDFSSVEDFVAFVLQEVLEDMEGRPGEEDERVKRRLQALGYLE